MNIGILTEGAFSAFEDTNWVTRLAILTNGAFTPFVVITPEPEVIIFGIQDTGYTNVSDVPVIIIRDSDVIKNLSKNVTDLSDSEKELIDSVGLTDIDSKNIKKIVDTDITDISDTNIEE